MNRSRPTGGRLTAADKIPPRPPFEKGGNGGIYGKTLGLLVLIAAISLTPSACSSGPLTLEKVEKRIQNGHLVTDRSRICMLQDTFQAQSVLPIDYNGKTYYG